MQGTHTNFREPVIHSRAVTGVGPTSMIFGKDLENCFNWPLECNVIFLSKLFSVYIPGQLSTESSWLQLLHFVHEGSPFDPIGIRWCRCFAGVGFGWGLSIFGELARYSAHLWSIVDDFCVRSFVGSLRHSHFVFSNVSVSSYVAMKLLFCCPRGRQLTWATVRCDYRDLLMSPVLQTTVSHRSVFFSPFWRIICICYPMLFYATKLLFGNSKFCLVVGSVLNSCVDLRVVLDSIWRCDCEIVCLDAHKSLWGNCAFIKYIISFIHSFIRRDQGETSLKYISGIDVNRKLRLWNLKIITSPQVRNRGVFRTSLRVRKTRFLTCEGSDFSRSQCFFVFSRAKPTFLRPQISLHKDQTWYENTWNSCMLIQSEKTKKHAGCGKKQFFWF